MAFLGCSEPRIDDQGRKPADILFVGENILTLDAATETATGVAVRGEQIVAVDDADAVYELKGPNTRVIELGTQALMPGFVDSHGHLTFSARLLDFVNLASPPVGTALAISDVQALLADRLAKQPPAPGGWLVGFGYDDSLLKEGRHPNRDDLDAVSSDVPILIVHVSGHLAVANTPALAAQAYSAETADPPGGVIRRRPGSREPDGVLEETAASAVLYARIATIAPDRLERMLRDAALAYAARGITTAQDGAISPGDIRALRSAVAKEPLPIDLIAFQHESSLDQTSLATFEPDPEYVGGFRLGGVKFSLDGSPQGRTAWVTKPYTEGPHGAPPDYVAYPTVDPDEYKTRVGELIRRGVPVLVHANGDAAIDLMLDGVDEALAGSSGLDHRSVIIHAQLMREDQVNRAHALDAIPSFFSAHTFFWGDWHLRSFGTSRGANISPTGWAKARGLRYTIHNDAPVVPPDMMRLIWATVNRQTRSGQTIGPGQRVGVMDALEAATLSGAYQNFEENQKGSISAGKLADLVILGADPTAVDPTTIKDIPIVETFARGRSVYRWTAGLAQ